MVQQATEASANLHQVLCRGDMKELRWGLHVLRVSIPAGTQAGQPSSLYRRERLLIVWTKKRHSNIFQGYQLHKQS